MAPPTRIARLGFAKLNYFRLGYFQPWIKVMVASTFRTSLTRIEGVSITHLLNHEPDTCTLRVSGFVPAKGHELRIWCGYTDVSHQLFGGQILNVSKVYEDVADAAHLAYDVQAVDYTWLLNRRKVIKKYTAQSASAIIIDLIATYSTGFTVAHVVPDLPVIDEITFTNDELPDAITRVMSRAEVGGYWYVDYGKDVHAFIDEDEDAAPIVDGALRGAWDLKESTDLSQIVTRVFVRGGGSTASSEVLAGATLIPVEDGIWYAAAGGLVESGAQRITYTGKSTLDGQGALVTGASSTLTAPTAPSAADASNSAGNLSVGAYAYKTTFVTASTDSPESNASGGVTIAASSAPTAPTAAASTTLSGPLVAGALYGYKATFYNTKGETAGGSNGGVTPGAISAPGAPSATTVASTSGLLIPPPGSSAFWDYKVTFVTSVGETAAGSQDSDQILHVSAPTTGPSTAATTGGSMALGYYYYYVTYVTAAGETTAYSNWTSVTLSGGNNAVSLTSIPTSGDGRVTARKIYRSAVNGGGSGGLVTTIANNTTTTHTDTIADSSLGVTIPASNTSGSGQIGLTSIPTSADGRVTARKIYRTTAGGALYKLLTTIANNTTTTFTDNIADGSLGDQAPSTDTASGAQVNLTSLPTGPTGTTGRKLYRTIAAGSDYYFIGQIANNTATTFTDSASDQQILTAASMPTTSTFDGGAINVTGIQVGPAGTTKRKLYRTEANGAVYRYLTTIGDNTTTTFADNVADDRLGELPPISVPSVAGVAAGATTLLVTDLAQFPAAGWVRIGGQLVSYTGRTAGSGVGSLTGIPASGTGSLTAALAAGASVLVQAHLTGVSGIVYTINQGDQVNVLAQVDDAAAQAVMAALGPLFGDGVHEAHISDGRLSLVECIARGTAELALRKDPLTTVTYSTRDPTQNVGYNITIAVTAPAVSGTHKVQSVTLSQIGITGGVATLQPVRTITASSRRFSFEDILRKIKEQAA